MSGTHVKKYRSISNVGNCVSLNSGSLLKIAEWLHKFTFLITDYRTVQPNYIKYNRCAKDTLILLNSW